MDLRAKLVAGVAFVGLFAGAAPYAAAQQITSTVRGVVTSPAGEPVPGALVTVTDTRTGRSRTTSTNATGVYNVSNLEVGGPYTVLVDTNDFQDTRIDDLRISLSDTTQLNVTLSPLTANVEEILVLGAATQSVNLAIGPGSAFTLDTLQNVPSIARDIRDTLRLDARVQIDESNDDAISCAGTNTDFNALFIDGVSTSDPFGLNASGFPARNAQPIPFDAVGAVSVEFAPFDVEYNNFSGCAINLIHRSGTNEIHGEVFAVFNSQSLTGSTIDGEVVSDDPFRDFNWGASIGGPIIKDKLFLFVAYEETDDSDIQPQGPLGGGFADEFNFLTVDQAAVFEDALNARGFPTGGIASVLPEFNRRISTRLDWNITDRHNAAFTYSRFREENIEDDDFNFGSQFFTFNDSFEIEGTEQEFYSLRVFSQWTDNFSTDFRISRSDNTDLQDPIGGGEAQDAVPIPRIVIGAFNDADGDGVIEVGNDEFGSVGAGPGQFRSANELFTQNDQLRAQGEYQYRNHRFKFGYELNSLDVENLFIVNATGTIVFPTLEDFLAGNASTDTGTNFDEVPDGDEAFNGEIPAAFGSGSFTGDPFDAAAVFTRSIHSIYFQDEWLPIPDLTVQFGVRYDFYTNSTSPTENPNFIERFGFTNATGFENLDLIQPRIGITYDVPRDLFGQLTIQTGAGVFGGGDPTVFFSNSFQNFGGAIGFGASSFDPCTPEDFQFGATGPIFIPECITAQQIAEATEFDGAVAAIDPDFELPSVIRANIGFSHISDFRGAFGGFFDNWQTRIDFLYSRERNAFNFVNLTATPITTDITGRPVFAAVDPLNEGCDATFLGLEDGIPLGFDNVTPECFAFGARDEDILVTNGGGGTTLLLSAQFAKRFDYVMPWLNKDGFIDFGLSYAFLDASNSSSTTSSTANGNAQNTAIPFVNFRPVSTSNFERPHALTLNFGIGQEFFRDLMSRVDFIFRARSGESFSFVFNLDPFGDNLGFDDFLLFVPDGPDDPNVVFADDFPVEEFFEFVEASGLSEFAGGIAPRNAFNAPFETDLDVRFTQDLPTFIQGHRAQFFIDIENLPNLISDSANETLLNGTAEDIITISPFTQDDLGSDPAGNVLEFNDFNPFTAEPFTNLNGTLWAVQLGLRYQF